MSTDKAAGASAPLNAIDLAIERLVPGLRACHYERARTELAEARTSVSELAADRDRLQAKLDTNRCGRGHETLPLVLWDCPECHQQTKDRLTALIAASEAALKAGVMDIDGEPDKLREAIASARAEIQRGAGGIVSALIEKDHALHDAIVKHWYSLPKDIWDAAIEAGKVLGRIAPKKRDLPQEPEAT